MKPTLRIKAPGEHAGMIYEVTTPEGEVLHGVTEIKIHIRGGNTADVWVKFLGVEIDVEGEAEIDVGLAALQRKRSPAEVAGWAAGVMLPRSRQQEEGS